MTLRAPSLSSEDQWWAPRGLQPVVIAFEEDGERHMLRSAGRSVGAAPVISSRHYVDRMADPFETMFYARTLCGIDKRVGPVAYEPEWTIYAWEDGWDPTCSACQRRLQDYELLR